MKKILLTSLMGFLAWGTQAQEDLSQYVDPMIGTAKMGHTYPGATVPFGSVQLSPDTDTIPYEVNGRYNPEVYRYCAGYQYDDATIVGFSHTHFSGTGHSDLGDFLMMPTSGPLQLNPGTEADPDSGYRSRFSHDREHAAPAYYQVTLDDYDIDVELTATTRVGVHRYTFAQGEDAHVILDLMAGIYNYDDKNVWTFMREENDTLVTGFRETTGWARTRKVFFALSFDKPIKQYGNRKYDEKQAYRGFWGRFNESENFPEIAGRKIRAYFDFDLEDGEQLIAKMAISPVSTAGAIKNMQAETPGWDFDAIHQAGVDSWNKELHKVQVKTIQESDKVNFYTAMYHAFLGPTVYGDVDGRYRGLDMNIHQAEGFTNYTSFSLWDTYRALHPLFNVLQPARNRDMVKSMLAHYDQSVHPMLPIWSHYANENWCMIGYHSASVIADAVVKETVTADLAHALDAAVTTAQTAYFDGIGAYMEKGYVPEDVSGASVSKTLEYAYDDWAIAQMADKIGNASISREFAARAENYKNVYDQQTGFMRPKLKDGSWKQGFDPLDTHGQGFIEGNAWNYSLYVPHAPQEMINMMGGDHRFVEHLDSLFSMDLPDRYFANTEDISREGIIGNYVHGNEPSHHVVYLYNWTDQAWKSHDKIRMILRAMYQTGADGLGGNDDFGQMSAWYLFSALGFYPVAPGSVEYALGSPLVEEATLNLENGKTFTVEAQNQSEKNQYVSKVLLNGEELHEPFIRHADIMKGGKLTFIMKGRPNKKIFSKD
ncbi:GH92 family glycosyl hydrolase [Echinicola vietnamensis]|uniref:Alpha-1,2-mannosidase, putative n=1 Tax=Echinicola vietnamensis (strain DSM 17526 / LMG 23754 / KMM 6221) TaxID=926556 RepID=L0G487_ECHVK|nr:GH92 family glycosyl hydrolase [Echinicola vietnamensis]AGA80118.1 alpha-1,2-mannosidase, putative [Echinicola vietnamensis DSM 17526]